MWLLRLLFLLLLCIAPVRSIQRNYNAYNYDMTTPQFTPDGRLLQVEYASLAATHSSPCVIWKLPVSAFGIPDEITLVVTAKSSRKIQNRLVPLSSTTAVCLSGVVSDSMALLAKVYELQDSTRRLYGSRSTLTGSQIANSIAMSCQRHSFGGGIRPYGSTMVILSTTTPALQTDPSGAVWTITESLHLVGGGGDAKTTTSEDLLRRSLEQGHDSNMTCADALVLVAKHLIPSLVTPHVTADDAWLEVMVIHNSRGIHKLTDNQIERLLAKLRGK